MGILIITYQNTKTHFLYQKMRLTKLSDFFHRWEFYYYRWKLINRFFIAKNDGGEINELFDRWEFVS